MLIYATFIALLYVSTVPYVILLIIMEKQMSLILF